MNHELAFEAELFELSPSKSCGHTCHCAKCQHQHQHKQEIIEQDETSEELAFEEELFNEVSRAPVWLPAEKVCWLQNVLNRAETENLKPDGIFGPLTRGAVQRFQTRQNLQVDGIVGPQTETALIQAALNTVAQASLVPTNGVLDLRTRQEIKNFQTRQRLVVDGVVGPATRAAMVKALGGRCQIVFRPAPQPKPDRPPHLIPIDPKPASSSCNKAELSRRVDACIADSKRCIIEAGQDLALALAACKLNPLCNAAAVGKSLLTIKRCREALLRCDATAKAATNCQ